MRSPQRGVDSNLDLCNPVSSEARVMALQVKPETELLVEQLIASGKFHSVDEIIQSSVRQRVQPADAQQWENHRQAIERTREFVNGNPIRLDGISFQELIDEGRRL
jgi:Arc/MetJ-type ribon-helix-helix transcriptional regulator